jgi:hypothetical protein
VTEAAPLLVYGLGRSGGAVVARARRAGAAVLFLEARPDGDDVAAALSAGAERALDVADALRRTPPPRTCVAAPGVPIDHPDLEAIRSAGVETIGEVVWVLRDAPARTVGDHRHRRQGDGHALDHRRPARRRDRCGGRGQHRARVGGRRPARVPRW